MDASSDCEPIVEWPVIQSHSNEPDCDPPITKKAKRHDYEVSDSFIIHRSSKLLTRDDLENTAKIGRPKEVLVQSRLARWWRNQGKKTVSSGALSRLTKSSNPNTLLFYVAQ